VFECMLHCAGTVTPLFTTAIIGQSAVTSLVSAASCCEQGVEFHVLTVPCLTAEWIHSIIVAVTISHASRLQKNSSTLQHEQRSPGE
jgi:hypothetical protein